MKDTIRLKVPEIIRDFDVLSYRYYELDQIIIDYYGEEISLLEFLKQFEHIFTQIVKDKERSGAV